MTDAEPIGSHGPLRLLQELAERVPHTRGALLLSSTGLARAAHNLDTDDADHLAALASGLYSLGNGVGAWCGDGARVRQIVVELAAALFVTTAADGTRLAVLAAREADPAVLSHRMALLFRSLRPDRAG